MEDDILFQSEFVHKLSVKNSLKTSICKQYFAVAAGPWLIIVGSPQSNSGKKTLMKELTWEIRDFSWGPNSHLAVCGQGGVVIFGVHKDHLDEVMVICTVAVNCVSFSNDLFECLNGCAVLAVAFGSQSIIGIFQVDIAGQRFSKLFEQPLKSEMRVHFLAWTQDAESCSLTAPIAEEDLAIFTWKKIGTDQHFVAVAHTRVGCGGRVRAAVGLPDGHFAAAVDGQLATAEPLHSEAFRPASVGRLEAGQGWSKAGSSGVEDLRGRLGGAGSAGLSLAGRLLAGGLTHDADPPAAAEAGDRGGACWARIRWVPWETSLVRAAN